MFGRKKALTSEEISTDRVQKIIKNLQRLERYVVDGNIKGVIMQVKYLESQAAIVPATLQECRTMIEEYCGNVE